MEPLLQALAAGTELLRMGQLCSSSSNAGGCTSKIITDCCHVFLNRYVKIPCLIIFALINADSCTMVHYTRNRQSWNLLVLAVSGTNQKHKVCAHVEEKQSRHYRFIQYIQEYSGDLFVLYT